jgi:hypothetical protein
MNGVAQDVLIKEVGGWKIWLRETTLDRHALKILIFFSMVSIIVTGSILHLYQNDPVCGMSLLFIALVTTGIITTMLLKNDYRPAYIVHTAGADGIVIFKTTPEADQVAICRAAQELEVKIKEMIKEKRMLETIGGRCK